MAGKYSSSDIKVLKGLDAVLKRPGMYIGNTDDGSGLHHMLWEVVSNSLDLFMIDQCSEITVILHSDDSVEVIDDGKGIPLNEIEGKTFLERVMTELHCTATFDGHAPHTHVGGIHGVGLAVVNALSSHVEVNIFSNGQHHQQRFSNSKPVPMKNLGKTNKSGTSIRFTPSKKYFTNVITFDENIIKNRLKELSFLNMAVKFNFVAKDLTSETYEYKQGLVTHLKQTNHLISKIISTTDEHNGVKVDVAFAWTNKKGNMQSFANNLNTKDGGVHVNGLVAGLAKAINHDNHGFSSKNYETAIVKNLVAIIHINIADPAYGAPTKDRLLNDVAFEAVKNIVYEISVNEFSRDTKLLKIFSKN